MGGIPRFFLVSQKKCQATSAWRTSAPSWRVWRPGRRRPPWRSAPQGPTTKTPWRRRWICWGFPWGIGPTWDLGQKNAHDLGTNQVLVWEMQFLSRKHVDWIGFHRDYHTIWWDLLGSSHQKWWFNNTQLGFKDGGLHTSKKGFTMRYGGVLFKHPEMGTYWANDSF